MIPNEVNPDDIVKEKEYNGHHYFITREKTDRSGGYEYEFKLYVNGRFETTATNLDSSWHPKEPWVMQLQAYAEERIDFLVRHSN